MGRLRGSFDPGARTLRPSDRSPRGVATPRKAAHDVVTWLIPHRCPQPAARLMRRGSGLAPGLLFGAAVDVLLAGPRRGRPGAAFGAAASRAGGRLWAPAAALGEETEETHP